jgi:dTDP-3-amino-3,4,6-trideoxy-alpha-D-glucose transaminase
MNDFRRQWADTAADVHRAVRSVGESGWYILGERVRSFEASLARCWGAEHAIGMASGLDAIELALRANGVKRGDKVLTTPMSAFATTMAIVRLGAIPVFCDTDSNGLIDCDQARQALQAFPEIRYFVPVHLYGIPLNADRLRSLIEEFSLICVEDCAQSILASPLVGAAAATSFYPTKNLGAMGDGGAVVTNDSSMAARMRQLRDYGQSAKYVHSEIGWNSRLDELHAAILHDAFLPRLADWTARRREIAARYLRGWKRSDIRAITGAPPGACWHLFPVFTAHKASLITHLRASGIGCGEHYPHVIPDQPAMQRVNYIVHGDVPNARRVAEQEVSLPIHPYMTDHEVDCVLAALGQWQGQV